jgi:N-acyl-D-amino-acid deacylase
VEIWHLKVSGKANWGRMSEVIARIQAARASGIDVTADMYPYIASANGLDATIPDWAHSGGVDEMVKRIKDPETRARIIAEIRKDGFHPEDILILFAIDPDLRAKYAGKRLDEVAKERNQDPAEALLDLVAQDKANVGVARFGMNEDDVKLGLSQPFVSMCTDYGAQGTDGPLAEGSAHPRAFASTARILGHYVRDEKLFSVEEAVRKMTSLPARRLNLQDRGLIRKGMKADLVAFDPLTVKDTATFEKPFAYPDGILDVVVNGQLVLRDGKRTGARPGRALLHAP